MATKRDIEAEILEGIREIARGGGRRFTVEALGSVKAIRERMRLSQTAFSALLGVSLRTLQDWEQGRRRPTGAARSLLMVAQSRPDVLEEVLATRLSKTAKSVVSDGLSPRTPA